MAESDRHQRMLDELARAKGRSRGVPKPDFNQVTGVPRELRGESVGQADPESWGQWLYNNAAEGLSAGAPDATDRKVASFLTGGSTDLPESDSGRGMGVLDFVPFLGEAASAGDTTDAYKRGDKVGMALGALGAIVPGAGKVGRKLLKGGAEVVEDVAKEGKLARGAKAARKGGQYLLEKSPASKKAQAAADARKAAAQAAEDEAGYDPFNARGPQQPPAPEAPVDPNAPLVHQPTRTGAFDYGAPNAQYVESAPMYIPPRGVPERSRDLLSRPDVQEKTLEGIERGRALKDWYETGPLKQAFTDELGHNEGTARFEDFIRAVGATSPRSDVGTNIRNASYYYTLAKTGRGMPVPVPNPDKPGKFIKNPAPYGHLAQDLHRGNIEKVLGLRVGQPGRANQIEGYDFQSNPKPIGYTADLLGDPSRVAVDTHAFRAPAMYGEDPRFLETRYEVSVPKGQPKAPPRNIYDEVQSGRMTMAEALDTGAYWQSKPKENEYSHWQDWYRDLANRAGMAPREAQAAGWAGSGRMTGLESDPNKMFMDFMEDRLLHTQAERDTKLSPREILANMIRGKAPLLSLAAAPLGAAALQQRPGDDNAL